MSNQLTVVILYKGWRFIKVELSIVKSNFLRRQFNHKEKLSDLWLLISWEVCDWCTSWFLSSTLSAIFWSEVILIVAGDLFLLDISVLSAFDSLFKCNESTQLGSLVQLSSPFLFKKGASEILDTVSQELGKHEREWQGREMFERAVK